MNGLLLGILVSLAPVVELRGGLPIAIASGAQPGIAFLACVAANILVFPILFWFLEHIHYRFMHVGAYRSAFDKFMARTRRKAEPLVEKYGLLGLMILVAIPLPGTGVYTGTLAAWFFGVKWWQALIAIIMGTLVAGVIVLAASVGGMSLMNV